MIVAMFVNRSKPPTYSILLVAHCVYSHESGHGVFKKNNFKRNN